MSTDPYEIFDVACHMATSGRRSVVFQVTVTLDKDSILGHALIVTVTVSSRHDLNPVENGEQ